MFCRECGFKNREESNFCRVCGTRLENTESEQLFVLDDRYLVMSVLKKGGMGAVYKAEDSRLGGFVAIKKILLNNPDNNKNVYRAKRFREEARILFNLHHTGLPKVTDFFSATDPETGANAQFLVMTFVNGRDLETLMQENGNNPLAPERILNYMVQALSILSYLHTQKPPVFYRDLKPSNIMIQEDTGKVFLVDFGIAKQPADYQAGTRIGTRGFAAPEQYHGLADQRTDLYGLGATIHFLFTGIDPQRDDGAPFKFEPVRKLNPHVPEAVEELINSMLDINPARRPSSAEEVLKELERIFGPVSKARISEPEKPGPLGTSTLSPFVGGVAPEKKISFKKATWQTVKTFKGQAGSINCIKFSKDGRFLASGAGDWSIRIWDVEKSIPVASLEDHEGEVRSVAFSPDGLTLASASDDMTIRLWDWKHGNLERLLGEYNMPLLSIDYSADGRTILTGTLGNTLSLWDQRSGKCILVMDRHYSSVFCAIYSTDGRIISGSGDRTVRMWDPMTGRQLHIFEKHTMAVRWVAQSPDGRVIASASDDLTICLWNRDEKVLTATLEGHNEPVTALCFSPDGKFLASGSDDKTVRIWDLSTNRLDSILRGHKGDVRTVAFSPEGKYLASGSGDRTIRIWRLG